MSDLAHGSGLAGAPDGRNGSSDNPRVMFVVPAYREGSGIARTLESISSAAESVAIRPMGLILSDSSPDRSAVEAAEAWALQVDWPLYIDHMDTQRSVKEALNVAFAHRSLAESDIVVELNADALINPAGLSGLLAPLITDRQCVLSAGVSAPDPEYRQLRYRAGAWQMSLHPRLAQRLTAERRGVDGVFWAARTEFITQFRFDVDGGSIHDDIQLHEALMERGLRFTSVSSAEAYKVPTGTLRDFAIQTHRAYIATDKRAGRPEFRIAAANAAADPLGFILYCAYRVASRALLSRYLEASDVQSGWTRLTSTLRP